MAVVSEDWKHLLAWQVVDPRIATIQEMLQAPIVFFNGHDAPEFSVQAKENLKAFVEQGGFIFADACCHNRAFDAGFKRLMKELFPDPGFELRPLPEDHPVWRSKHLLSPECTLSWASSTAAAQWSFILRKTFPATGTNRSAARPTRP